jgi:acetyl esterase/lipase
MSQRTIIIILTALAFCSCNREDILDPAKSTTLYNVSYGSHNRHKLDIVLPANRNSDTPVVIFIHGGAWVSGTKEVFLNEIKMFAGAGIACATMNYRYASGLFKVHHPALPEDIRLAVDYISSRADKWDISPSKFGLAGHSAGGHLSLITAYSFHNGKIKAAASWAGPVDMTNPDQLSVGLSGEMFEVYMGTPLNSSSDSLKYRNASPYYAVNAQSVPTLLVYATQDEAVPYSNALMMEQKLTEMNNDFKLVTLTGATHIWTGSYLETARNETLQWFQLKLAE